MAYEDVQTLILVKWFPRELLVIAAALKQSSCSLCIPPCDYRLFRSRNYYLHCRRFTEFDEVTAAVDDFLRSKHLKFYRGGIHSVQGCTFNG